MAEFFCMGKCGRPLNDVGVPENCMANGLARCAPERRFREVFEHSSDALFVVGVGDGGDLYFESVNPVAELAFGLPATVLEGSALTDIVEGKLGRGVGGSLAADLDVYRRCIATGLPIAYDSKLSMRSQKPDEQRLYRVHLLPLLDDSGIVRVICIGHDVTERRKYEESLLRQTQLREQLASHREEVLDEERKRIARDLHEELGQLLTALRMDIATLPIQFGDALKARAQEMQSLIDLTIQGMRNVVTSLRTATLESGLCAALEWLTRDFSQRSGIECRLILPKTGTQSLDESRSTAVFRIVQEALTNVARHAGAGRVDIHLGTTAAGWQLTVRDDGRGFDPRRTDKSSFGLLGMKERAAILGGRFAVSTLPHGGTEIEVLFPARKMSGRRNWRGEGNP